MTETSRSSKLAAHPPGGLAIERIEVIPVQVPLPRRYRGSYYHMDRRCTLITRVHTDSGIVGEAFNGDTDEGQAAIVRIIEEEIAPALTGCDVFAYESNWAAMLPCSFDILRDRSLSMQAIACVDTALWDAIGRALGMPLWRLWGGEGRPVPVIMIGGYYGASDAELAAEMERYLELGYAGCKFKVGRLSPEEDAHRIAVARRAAGDGFVLMADANQGYTTADAIEFVRRTRDLDLAWFEEPCRWQNDRLAMRDVRMIGAIPVTAGQTEVSRAGIRDLMASGAIDYCNADASWIGGPTEWRRLAAMATAYDVRMAHHEEAHIAVHFFASIPHGSFVESFHPERDPVFWQMLANRPRLRDGHYPAPAGPGLGIELDPDFVARHRV
ncbi:MAG: mandelate racemase/muconate lactonizing enzyme family protein [bacterium]|jgi:L-alanine-DL-glutamate epimerase-like enolase superfamily enzyme|nr:mandelate racemase/muconate lactonizing enzyme family protein [bacterium]